MIYDPNFGQTGEFVLCFVKNPIYQDNKKDINYILSPLSHIDIMDHVICPSVVVVLGNFK